jgi:hypothetical protein
VKRIKDLSTRIRETVVPMARRVAVARQEFQRLVATEAPLNRIETKLQEIAALEIQLQMADLGASRDILAVLSVRQKKRWQGIQMAARVRKGSGQRARTAGEGEDEP